MIQLGTWSDAKLPMLTILHSMVIPNTVGNRRRYSQRGRKQNMREKHPDFAPIASSVTEKPRGKRSFVADEQVHFERLLASVLSWSSTELGEILNYWISFRFSFQRFVCKC